MYSLQERSDSTSPISKETGAAITSQHLQPSHSELMVSQMNTPGWLHCGMPASTAQR